ncbi:peptidase M24, structural domain-containing protein [Collybia nuda]|uniref:Peptidase M24, structural domain-containing protein n=1 Tax=Collybia nuda TaxID=64659 RepID=A0A9P5XPS4_9AGAR|nr:peptidase M24, structural domain-containing protein [Collybia nuda]
MTGTKRSTPSSKWGYGWGVGKKQSEKEMGMASETEKEQSPVASQTNLPLYNKTQQSKSTFASKFPQRAQDTHQIRHAQLPRRPLVGPNNSTSTLVGSALDRKAEVDPIKGADKLKKLREHMATRNLAYYIVPSENVHGSEYVSENEKRLEFISGFTGIVGQAIVTMISAYLFTDSRYWLQAQEQLGAGWTLIKVGAAGQPRDYIEWLERTKGDKLGIDARLISHDKAVLLIKKMLSLKSNLVYPSQNLIDLIWDSKPAKSKAPIYIQPYEFTGMEATEKLRKLQEWIRQQPASMSAHSKASLNLSDMQVGTLISALPSIAYLLNLRGMDIPYSSVFHAYLFVGLDKIIIFIDYNKVTNEIREYIKSIGAQYQNYYEIWSFLKQRSWGEGKLLITPQTPYGISLMLAPDRYAVAPDFVQTMLSVKNKKEIDGLRKACLRDGVAYVRFLAWLEEKLHQHYEITEFEAVLRLAEFRRRNKNFISHTYKCISATGPNTALLSYKPKKTTARMIERDTPYLNDSGGLYKDGTCGVARTVHFGRPISEQCEVFTRVLQAHIAIDSAVFPEGISVNQLDILAHKAMWKDGFDIMRGSGQEFRPFLTVHESPQTFSSNNPLVPGHVVINEPGFYNEGRWGVRIESALIVRRVETKKRDFGDDSLLGFERLTCVLIQTQMVKTSMLAREEKQWLKLDQRFSILVFNT